MADDWVTMQMPNTHGEVTGYYVTFSEEERCHIYVNDAYRTIDMRAQQ